MARAVRPRPQRVAPAARSRHGLPPAAVDAMRDRQGGRCLICLADLRGAGVIDHDHALAARHGHALDVGCALCVRGILCDPCNRGLGAFRDSVESLLRAAAYLRAAAR